MEIVHQTKNNFNCFNIIKHKGVLYGIRCWYDTGEYRWVMVSKEYDMMGRDFFISDKVIDECRVPNKVRKYGENLMLKELI